MDGESTQHSHAICLQFGISGLIPLPLQSKAFVQASVRTRNPHRDSVGVNQPKLETQTSQLGWNNHLHVVLESESKLLENDRLFRRMTSLLGALAFGSFLSAAIVPLSRPVSWPHPLNFEFFLHREI